MLFVAAESSKDTDFPDSSFGSPFLVWFRGRGTVSLWSVDKEVTSWQKNLCADGINYGESTDYLLRYGIGNFSFIKKHPIIRKQRAREI